MSQPNWEFVTNLGDASPLDSGGLFLYRDITGVYGFEMERLERDGEEDGDENDPPARWLVHRVCLDRQKLVRHETSVYLVPHSYNAETYPHAVSSYPEWYVDSLDSIAATMGTSRVELETALCSEDGAQRAWAYQCLADYHGWENFDSEPLTLSLEEVEERYIKGELSNHRLADAVTLTGSHQRRGDYSPRKVRLPNCSSIGDGGKWEASPGDLIEFAYPSSTGSRSFARVLGRVDARTESPDIRACIGWLAVLELSMSGRTGFVRWIDPAWVTSCRDVPHDFLAFFFAPTLPSIPALLKLDELGSLTNSYIAKYKGVCEACIAEYGMEAGRRPCTHVETGESEDE